MQSSRAKSERASERPKLSNHIHHPQPTHARYKSYHNPTTHRSRESPHTHHEPTNPRSTQTRRNARHTSAPAPPLPPAPPTGRRRQTPKTAFPKKGPPCALFGDAPCAFRYSRGDGLLISLQYWACLTHNLARA
ncbi:uncharacterized protein K452DRAFT_290000 [Aplosporella prunicola CBS 121167]|uniref:Uncharacterized protein n=1 Tax=Aplosporella prunicola CBS 121167 TaxID=1176127 RepID=A0A6A6B852_9PEZI|nr:uncharacterized protein K452DRAFT_290000 [Aplosporella prunicola CBS 121167]KAF2139445.1 hypothetical protein K452DRAFT_290000 [Aplosporella prunicola CBS 121167]